MNEGDSSKDKKQFRRSKVEEDEAVVPEDLSVCSEDFYEMDIPEEPSSQKIVPTEIPKVQVPVLKGQYDVTDDQFTWVGVWGMGSGDSIFGTTSEFRYSAPIPPESDKSQPYSGYYNGYFGFKAEIPKRVYERNVKLEFTALEGRYL